MSERGQSGIAVDLTLTEHMKSAGDLSPLVLLAALDDPESGLLIFDAQLRVLHVTSWLHSFCQVPLEGSLQSPEVFDLLSRWELEPACLETVRDSIIAFINGAGKSEPLTLRTRNGSDGVQLRLRCLGSGFTAAYFDRVSPKASAVHPGGQPLSRDSLTGLASRSWFEAVLGRALDQTPETPLAVLLIDLDRFKAVNDTLGHAAGDRLLRLVAERLQSAIRKSDVAARFGGDEFAVLINPSPNREEPAAIARRILDLVQRTYLIEGQLVNIGTSIGIAQSPDDGTDGPVLLRNADLALYHSKASGRSTFHFFEVAMERRAQARRTSELELRKALALRQLELHYQPQVNAVAGQLVGFEALLRWRHPERGLIPPNLFLPLAEEIGAIVPIGDWVLRTACREATRWPSDIVVAVNASPLQFDTGTFAESVQRALQSTGLQGERLEIEITEGILLRNDNAVRKTLDDLRQMKVRVAMDDFGTGYASLSQLARFPFDKIKIDRSLIGFHGDDMKHRAIVRAIAALGKSLGICTLAEGVENAEQLARLQVDGCASVQGYFFGRAVPASELSEVISRLSSPGQILVQDRKDQNGN